LFNSQTHLAAFLTSLPELIRIMPDFRPKWVTRVIEEKSSVAYPGCHFSGAPSDRPGNTGRPPLIIWNHRWEHDKNPEAFFLALEEMIRRAIAFRVALLGEEFAQMPEVFKQAAKILGERLVQYGRVPSRQDYYGWLDRGDIVVSTAVQENFGIAVVEAMWHGCLPLLPNRLSYPEILPPSFHDDFLYEDQHGLEDKLARLLTGRHAGDDRRRALSRAMEKFAWENRIGQFDEELERLVHSS
jgi:glycosyltransferase involved in cell wall biosynthesis